MNDIVIDNNTMCLYNKDKPEEIKCLFEWLRSAGVLAISRKLHREYISSQGASVEFAVFLDGLIRDNRLFNVDEGMLRRFNMPPRLRLRSNRNDHCHIKLVCLSHRKKLVSQDIDLIHDVNLMPAQNRIQPSAVRVPDPDFYL